MNLKGLTEGSHFAVPIIGVAPIPIDVETGELLIPDKLTADQKKEVEAYFYATFPGLKKPKK